MICKPLISLEVSKRSKIVRIIDRPIECGGWSSQFTSNGRLDVVWIHRLITRERGDWAPRTNFRSKRQWRQSLLRVVQSRMRIMKADNVAKINLERL